MWKWSLTSVALNLLLGIPGVVPVWLMWYFAVNGPLADLGWTRREPTENDGMLLWLVIIVPVVAGFGLLWWLANYPVWRRIPLDSRLYWPASVLLTLAPAFVLMGVL
ncbi:hypothetical protein [Streptomyces sp. NPDC059092]|uniref:hypothetical protein n=1 Tax=Streptomyces sp. NPDC059092 TaxID=3346725 RepID=UPI0036CC1DD8